uniref:Uncharacterized protein n=1 Tax=Anguilla anguilla TaxID=7936 RepID=A0A0E9VE26_ANGAN
MSKHAWGSALLIMSEAGLSVTPTCPQDGYQAPSSGGNNI